MGTLVLTDLLERSGGKRAAAASPRFSCFPARIIGRMFSRPMKLVLHVCFLVLPLVAWGQGRIEIVGADSVDFGKYPAWEKKVARYTIRNAGEDILRILKVRKTCGCASATCDKKELNPGEEAAVEVVILPNSIFKLYSKNTYVESSDPGNRVIRLNVAGNAVPLVDVDPKAEVYLGRTRLNTPRAQSFLLRATRKGVRLGEPAVESSHPVQTALAPVAEAGDGHWRLNVQVLPSDRSGDFKCSVKARVKAPAGHVPVAVKLSGKIGYELVAIPGIVRLPVSEAAATRRCAFRVMGQRTRVLKPEDLELPEHDHVSFRVSTDRVRRALSVAMTFSPEFTRELFAQETIPLSFRVVGASSATVVCKSMK